VAYYIGTILDDEGYRALIKDVASDLDLAAFDNLPPGVELSVRSGSGKQLLFVLNLTKGKNELQLPVAALRSALTGEAITQPLVLEPMGVEVLLLQ
jgi:beta-galactosidase